MMFQSTEAGWEGRGMSGGFSAWVRAWQIGAGDSHGTSQGARGGGGIMRQSLLPERFPLHCILGMFLLLYIT